MKELDCKTWKLFIERNKLTDNELNNEELCTALRKTVAFSLLRVNVAFEDLKFTIINRKEGTNGE